MGWSCTYIQLLSISQWRLFHMKRVCRTGIGVRCVRRLGVGYVLTWSAAGMEGPTEALLTTRPCAYEFHGTDRNISAYLACKA